MMEEKRDIKSLSLEELEEELTGKGLKAFRARQVFQWIHEKTADSFEDMTNLSRDLRQQLSKEYDLATLTTEDVRISKIDGTRKYLFGLDDGHVIESVWMKYKHGNSVCVSSQVGCRMGCRFCASTLDGLVRSLRPSEMADQIYQIQKDTGERVSHVVVMGSGEPLDNYDNLVTRRAKTSAREISRCPPAALCRALNGLPGRGSPSPWPCPFTPQMTR